MGDMGGLPRPSRWDVVESVVGVRLIIRFCCCCCCCCIPLPAELAAAAKEVGPLPARDPLEELAVRVPPAEAAEAPVEEELVEPPKVALEEEAWWG